MNAYTMQQFEDALKETNYKHIGLFTTNGKQLVTYNNNSQPVAKKLIEIKQRLKSPTCPDGIYIIRAKNILAKAGVYDEFPIKKGNVKDLAPVEKTEPKTLRENNPEVTSYKEVLKLQNRITELTFENAALQKEIDDLEEKLEAAEDERDELKEAPKNLAEASGDSFFENAGKWLQQTITTVSPMIDKHYELKELALKNETARLMILSGKTPPAQQQLPPAQKTPPASADPSAQFLDKRIQSFIIGFENEPEQYEALAALYNQATEIDGFYQSIKDYDEQIFNDLIAHINAKQ